MPTRNELDPALRRYLEETTQAASAEHVTDAELARIARSGMTLALKKLGPVPVLPNGAVFEDIEISDGLRARLYSPVARPARLPVLIFAHGGGWVAGSVATHDPFCRLLCAAAGVLVLSVEYRLAPEHPFPAGLEDVEGAFYWAVREAARNGGDASRLALGGDSAGANLAASAAQRLLRRGEGGPLRALLLLYPITDHPSSGHPSYVQNAVGYGLTAARMRWFWAKYAADISEDEVDISLLRANPAPRFPPTLVATAEFDPLKDEGQAYAMKLISGGVDVTHVHAWDMHHNFPVHPGTVAKFPQCQTAMEQFSAWLRATLF